MEDPIWTKRYHAPGADKAFGGHVIITMEDGRVIEDELAIADANPLGARPFGRPQYVEKFRTLAEGIIEPAEQDRFLALVARLPELNGEEVRALNFVVPADRLGPEAPAGIF